VNLEREVKIGTLIELLGIVVSTRSMNSDHPDQDPQEQERKHAEKAPQAGRGRSQDRPTTIKSFESES
jgi:hypothetical protein